MELINSVGRRKTSVARLYMKSGKGVFKINGLDLEKYFTSELLQLIIKQPIEAIDVKGKLILKLMLIWKDSGFIKKKYELIVYPKAHFYCGYFGT